MTDAPKHEHVDFWSLLAVRKRGMPEGWRWHSLRAVGHPAPREQCTAVVKGAVCSVMLKSGPFKGTPNWAKLDKSTERELAIPFPEFDAFLLEWETETGRCHECFGNGFVQFGIPSNFERRRCSWCGGDGKARVTT